MRGPGSGPDWRQPTGQPAAGCSGGPGRPPGRAGTPDDVTGRLPGRWAGGGGLGPSGGAGVASQCGAHRSSSLSSHQPAYTHHEGRVIYSLMCLTFFNILMTIFCKNLGLVSGVKFNSGSGHLIRSLTEPEPQHWYLRNFCCVFSAFLKFITLTGPKFLNFFHVFLLMMDLNVLVLYTRLFALFPIPVPVYFNKFSTNPVISWCRCGR